MIKSFRGEYGFLSNFYPVLINHDGRVYPSVEHAYQSTKNHESDWKEFCQHQENPRELKKAAKQQIPSRYWHQHKIELMAELLRQKFNNVNLAKLLLATGQAQIIEGNTWGDRFWGMDQSGQGENNLGKLLMIIRRELQQKTKASYKVDGKQ